MKVHAIKRPRKPCWLLFWKKSKLADKSLCGRDLDKILYSPDTMAINCKSCRRLMRKVD
jgi:hypothetical protein